MRRFYYGLQNGGVRNSPKTGTGENLCLKILWLLIPAQVPCRRGVAAPIAENAPAANSAPLGAEGVAAPGTDLTPDPEATITQTVARRLKEETEKFHGEESPKIRQQARDEMYKEMNIEWPPKSGKIIQTEADYKQAERENKIIQQYQAQGLPDEIIEQLTEVEKLKEWQKGITDKEAPSKRPPRRKRSGSTARSMSSIKEFPEYATDAAKIPQEVRTAHEKYIESGGRTGMPLTAAMAQYLYRQNVKKTQTAAANGANAATGTGSAKGSGPANKSFTYDEVKNMTTEEIAANLDAIKEARKHW